MAYVSVSFPSDIIDIPWLYNHKAITTYNTLSGNGTEAQPLGVSNLVSRVYTTGGTSFTGTLDQLTEAQNLSNGIITYSSTLTTPPPALGSIEDRPLLIVYKNGANFGNLSM
jgi:hypothetical protein